MLLFVLLKEELFRGGGSSTDTRSIQSIRHTVAGVCIIESTV